MIKACGDLVPFGKITKWCRTSLTGTQIAWDCGSCSMHLRISPSGSNHILVCDAVFKIS